MHSKSDKGVGGGDTFENDLTVNGRSRRKIDKEIRDTIKGIRFVHQSIPFRRRSKRIN